MGKQERRAARHAGRAYRCRAEKLFSASRLPSVESRHGFTTAHWDQEPKAPASRTHSKRLASLWDVETARQRLECVELAPAF